MNVYSTLDATETDCFEFVENLLVNTTDVVEMLMLIKVCWVHYWHCKEAPAWHQHVHNQQNRLTVFEVLCLTFTALTAIFAIVDFHIWTEQTVNYLALCLGGAQHNHIISVTYQSYADFMQPLTQDNTVQGR